MALMMFASMAQASEPAAGFERFAGCPSKTEKEAISTCLLAGSRAAPSKWATKKCRSKKK